MENPFESPLADSSDAPVDNAPRPLWQAVTVGVFTDIGGSLFLGIALSIIYAIVLLSLGKPVEQFEEAIDNPLSPFNLAGNALGLSVSLVAGCVCGLMSRGREIRVCLITAITCTLIMSMLVVATGTYDPSLLVVAPLSFGATLLGGWLVARRRGDQLD